VLPKSNIRLFIENPIKAGDVFTLNSGQSHYLTNVMKKAAGDFLCCLDNRTGEYLCRLKEIGGKQCLIEVIEKSRDFKPSMDIWLLFAPLKKDNTDFVIQKATELGVRRLIPVATDRTNTDKIRKDRFVLQSIEAAEQCRRLDLPQLDDLKSLTAVLKLWDAERPLFFMDETLRGRDIASVFADKSLSHKPAALLVGPEGGFTEPELEWLRSLPFAKGVNLGPRILRAETAVMAALSCWQALLGDWQNV